MIYYLLLCLILGAIFGGAYYAYRICFYSPAEGRDKIPSAEGAQYKPYRQIILRLFHQLQDRPYELVTVRTPDGLTLSGHYYHVADGAPVDIGFHGYRSSYASDFAGGSELSLQMGHNLLLVDQRAHGKSQGRTITFGIKERQDLICWVDYVIRRFGQDVKILLYGISMGGATVLMASELELPKNVKAIVADCPYSSPMDIIASVGRKMGYPVKILKPFVRLGAKVFGGFDVQEVSAEEAVKQAQVPILIIHGERDSFVPKEMSEVIEKANPERITRFTFPNANHGLSYLEDAPRYQAIVTDFLQSLGL